jgi:predicted acylesterase/phospholipase RssA
MTVWDMGAIAASADPAAETLFRDILIASASVPGVLPAQPLPTPGAAPHLHVDGGATGQVYVPILPRDVRRPQIQLVFNNGLSADPVPERAAITVVVQRSLSSLLRAQSRLQADLARRMAEGLGGEADVVSIPPDAPVARLQDFDADSIARTFRLGLEIGRQNALGCPGRGAG